MSVVVVTAGSGNPLSRGFKIVGGGAISSVLGSLGLETPFVRGLDPKLIDSIAQVNHGYQWVVTVGAISLGLRWAWKKSGVMIYLPFKPMTLGGSREATPPQDPQAAVPGHGE